MKLPIFIYPENNVIAFAAIQKVKNACSLDQKLVGLTPEEFNAFVTSVVMIPRNSND